MSYQLFLDDERDPPVSVKGWFIVRTYEQFQSIIANRGLPAFISFDHDLGADSRGHIREDGMHCVRWLCEYIMDNDPDLTNFDWYVHSQNPVGAKNINEYLGSFIRIQAGRLRE